MKRRDFLKKLLILPAIAVAPDVLGRIIPDAVHAKMVTLGEMEYRSMESVRYIETGNVRRHDRTYSAVMHQDAADDYFSGPPIEGRAGVYIDNFEPHSVDIASNNQPVVEVVQPYSIYPDRLLSGVAPIESRSRESYQLDEYAGKNFAGEIGSVSNFIGIDLAEGKDRTGYAIFKRSRGK